MRKIIQYYFVWLSPFTRSSDFQQIHQDQRVLISDTFECDQNHLDGAGEKYMRVLMFTWSDDVWCYMAISYEVMNSDNNIGELMIKTLILAFCTKKHHKAQSEIYTVSCSRLSKSFKIKDQFEQQATDWLALQNSTSTGEFLVEMLKMTFLYVFKAQSSRHVTTVTSWIFMEAESQEVRVFHDVYIFIY